jgi:magnesium transporter
VLLIGFYGFGFNRLLLNIVSLTIVLNILIAALMGTLLPLLFKKLKIDPAIASAPFISTTLDIVGQLIYFLITIAVIGSISI